MQKFNQPQNRIRSVKNLEQLSGRLSEIANHILGGSSHDRISDGIEIERALVRVVHEQIERSLGLDTLLFVAENEIDPFVQVLAHVVALESSPMQVNEMLGAFGPRWQCDIVHFVFGALQLAKVKVFTKF